MEKGTVGKMKQDDMLREIMSLFAQGKKDKAFQEYPALTLRYHAQITAMVKTRNELPSEIDHTKRLWIHGRPGTGKSAYVAWKYPKALKSHSPRTNVSTGTGSTWTGIAMSTSRTSDPKRLKILVWSN